MRTFAIVAVAVLLVAGCTEATSISPKSSVSRDGSTTSTSAVGRVSDTFGAAPVVGTQDTPAASRAFEEIAQRVAQDGIDEAALRDFVNAGDARHGWLISDLLRFSSSGQDQDQLVAAFGMLTKVDVTKDREFADSPWRTVTDYLIAWDTPAPPDYRQSKALLFTMIEPGWKPFFDDARSSIDWRWLSWGGVLIDDRRNGHDGTCSRGCIPALDDPALTAASQGGWYPDDAYVFGIVEGAEAVALPKNIMQVHEMVNITIGSRRFGIPYCTLCGSAQAFYTDRVPDGVETPVLRTSGLLSRSNKVMYDLNTASAFDTFTGEAVSGPLHGARLVLQQTTVTVSRWDEWKAAHPDTRIIARDGGIGRTYSSDPLRGRDNNGPIFPVGAVDSRLPIQEPILGVITAGNVAVAFPAAAARAALAAGKPVKEAGIELFTDGGGLRARRDGVDVPAHEAFWFAWSQFHPATTLWNSA
jgi:Protein of unknown function (DUF3179)